MPIKWIYRFSTSYFSLTLTLDCIVEWIKMGQLEMHEMSGLYPNTLQVCVCGTPSSKNIPILIWNGWSCKKVHLKMLIKFLLSIMTICDINGMFTYFNAEDLKVTFKLQKISLLVCTHLSHIPHDACFSCHLLYLLINVFVAFVLSPALLLKQGISCPK